MSQVKVSGNASGTGIFTIAAPNSNSNYTLTLPQATTTLVGTDATQTLTNKTINGGALQSGTAVASTSGTSIDFTGIPSWVKRITVMFSGMSTSGTSIPQIQLGAGSVTTTGYVASATGFQTTNLLVSSLFTTGFPFGADCAAAYSQSGAMIFTNISSNTWVGTLVGSTNNGGTPRTMHGGGTVALSGTLDRVRITTVNGTDTFDAGSINILYE